MERSECLLYKKRIVIADCDLATPAEHSPRLEKILG